ncbi:MAG: ABC-F family ATP-binding cassette domain-containing protein [Phycisphaerales bacterium]
MSLLAVTNLSHAYGTRTILDGITFAIEPGEKVGLVGRNGTGKSTLFRAIAGRLKTDAGTAQVSRGARVGMLEQEPSFDADETVFDAAEAAYAELHAVHAELEQVAAAMGEAEGDELDRLLKRYERLEREMERLGGYAIDHRIEETLHGLGFVDEQFKQSVHSLSGGQRSRLALTRLLLEAPDLLLLDEPTNHLDIDGRRWLENFLANEFSGAVLVISHDRYLLDRVVGRILELEVNGSIYTYPGNYAKFRELRQERKLVEQRVYEKQLDHVRREQQFIDRYRAGQRAKQAAGRESRLDRFRDQMADRPIELEVMKLNLPKAPRTGDIVVNADGLTKEYGDRTLFEEFSLKIERGDRIGIIGPNGCGKSTFIKCLLGELEPDEGKVRLGSGVSVGYFSQLHEGLDLELPVYRYLQSVILSLDGAAKASEQQARDLAGAFLFSGLDQEKPLGMLSGGERSRAILAGLVAGGHNLLVLDEPTNHFDIPSAERLEQSLDAKTGFDGTLILVSHDRALLDACVNQLIIFDGRGGARLFHGNYAAWREWTDRREAEARAVASEKAATPAPSKEARKKPNPTPTSSGDTSTKRGSLAKLSLSKLETRIEEIEKRVQVIDAELMDPATHRDGAKTKRLTDERAALQGELEPLEFEWASRAEEG